jgi:aspartate dehydrogenase
MSKKVALFGCGTIGREIAIAVDSGKVNNATIVTLVDSVDHRADTLRSNLQNSNPSTFTDFSKFVYSSSFKDADIIVEAASQDAVNSFGKKIVEAGKSLMIMSVGALGDPFFLSEMLDIAYQNGSHIYVPTGAIAGIDAIRSVKHLLDSVVLTTTKNPIALAGAPFFNLTKINVYEITEKTVIYDGNAADAVKKFPANINVAAILSLAGIGIKRTKVKIIADPYTDVNQHEITATGKFGEMTVIVRNKPSPNNPKTSFLAVLSAIECLRSICDDSIRIGT